MDVIDFERAVIVERSSDDLTLGPSFAVLAFTSAASGNSSDVSYYDAREPAALDEATYPSLAAVWNNEEDAIFDTL